MTWEVNGSHDRQKRLPRLWIHPLQLTRYYDAIKKNGHIHTGKQHHRCKDCGRQVVLQADNRLIDADQRRLVARLLREKISLHGICRAVGVRLRSARCLWANLPAVYREEATFYTDQYEVYKGVIPAERHKAITKKARETNHLERFNNTLHPRVSRLVRETLAFSKKLANHIGAIRYFICHYNLTRTTVLPV
jgi:insertion element IS1 protein InsB